MNFFKRLFSFRKKKKENELESDVNQSLDLEEAIEEDKLELKNKKINLNTTSLKRNFLYKIKGKMFVILFIIFCFGWNPKTVMLGDVASFPGYRIPVKVINKIFIGEY